MGAIEYHQPLGRALNSQFAAYTEDATINLS